MRIPKYRIPEFSSGVFKVWQRNWMIFRKSKLSNLIWMWFEPITIYFTIGYGLGSFIADMDGFSYSEYFLPSILAITSMMVAFFDGSYGNFPKLHQSGTFASMLTTALEPEQIVLGEILWSATKGTLSALGVVVAASFFGHIDSFNYIWVICVIFLSSYFFGALGFYFSTRVKTTDSLIIPTSLFIVPMSLLSGTYFSLERLPFGLKYLAYLFPLSHTVNLERSLVETSSPIWLIIWNLFSLLILSYITTRAAIKRLTAELII